MQRYSNTVATATGRAIVGAQIAVKTTAGTLATIYADDGITTKANPITSGVAGYFEFYAAPGDYSLTISGAGISANKIGVTLTAPPVVVTPPTPDIGPLAAASGASLVGWSDPVAPAFLKTLSDMKAGDPVSIFRALPKAEHEGLRNGTSTYDCAPAISDVTTYMNAHAIKGGVLTFPAATLKVQSSVPQLARVTWRGEGSRQSSIVWGRSDQIGYAKGVVYCVAGTDAVPDFVFSTNISGLAIDGNGIAPVALAMRGHQENCRASDLLLAGFTSAGLELLPFAAINHAISIEDIHILPADSATGAHGIRASHTQKCHFKNITTDISNASYYDRGIYLYNNPILNEFHAIHTEDCKYGFYVEGGANNLFFAIEASNHAGNGIAHFYTTGTRYQIRGMRTISGYVNHLQDSTNTVAASTDTDSVEIVRGGSFFRRIADTQAEISRGVVSHAGATGSGRTELLANGAISVGQLRYLEIDLGAGNVGFAGSLDVYSVGDVRYKTRVDFAGYADGAGGVSNGAVSAQGGTNATALTIGAPAASGTVGKFRIPITNTDATYVQTLEVAALVSAFGRQAVGITFV